MKISNLLTKAKVNVFTKTDEGDAIGAGPPDDNGRRQTAIPAGGELEIDLPQLPKNELKIVVVFDRLPIKNGLEGAKIIPGKRFGLVHHFEFYKQHQSGKEKYLGVLHFDFRGHDHKKIQELIKHIDPEVHHPETGIGLS